MQCTICDVQYNINIYETRGFVTLAYLTARQFNNGHLHAGEGQNLQLLSPQNWMPQKSQSDTKSLENSGDSLVLSLMRVEDGGSSKDRCIHQKEVKAGR